MAGQALLEGRLSIEAALDSGSREVRQLLIDRDKRYDWRLSRLARRADVAGVALSWRPREEIDNMAQGKTHGGILAVVGDRRYDTLESLLPTNEAAFIVMLDGVEDPYNFGGAIRATYAAGAHGLVVPPREWNHAAAIVGRASAGACERIPMAIANNAANAADFYRARGLAIAQTANSPDATSMYEADLTQPLFLLLGGERRGLTRSLHDADIKLRIPYGRDFSESLGTVGAAAVCAFEVLRQRS